MSEPSGRFAPIDHGEQCSCKLLALATGMDPRALTFEYCQRVLHKHWGMTCRHGQRSTPPAVAGAGGRWRDAGPIDPVKAILISNDHSGS